MNDPKYPLFIPVHPSEVSDGYHTFAELYDHRTALFINFLHTHKDKAFKTHLDDNGSKMKGWFIAGINSQYGQITYHLNDELWNLVNVPEAESNSDYDGHTTDDVLQRLLKLAKDDPQ